MKFKYLSRIILSTFLVLCIIGLQSCKKDENGITNPTNNYDENKWIYNQMSFWYLWNEHLPESFDKTRNTLQGDKYFESLLYKSGEIYGDRFSYIEENEDYSKTKGTTLSESGFGFIHKYGKTEIVETDNSSSIHYLYYVTYVYPNSPAAKAGIKRGDIIYKINDKYIDDKDISKDVKSIKVTYTQFTDSEIILKDSDPSAELTATQYSTSPIWSSKIIESNNKKIGYLCYKTFAKNTQQLLLNEFAKFKNAGVTEFVLDLRYNNGGLLNMAQYLGSLLIPKDKLGGIYFQQVGNKNITNKDYILEFNSLKDNTILSNKIEIDRLYILTGSYTASASETTIFCMKPYLNNVYVIGCTTRGKNQSSVELKDSKYRWILHPIVARIYDCNHNTFSETGIVPDYKIEEDYHLPFRELGDKDEPLLNIALYHINNNSFPSTGKTKAAQANELILIDNDRGGNRVTLNSVE